MKFTKLALATLLTTGALFAGNYKIDPSHSDIGFKVKHMMISNVKGNFEQFSGDFVYDEKTNTLKSLEGFVKVSSINTNNEKRDAHLKSSEFFEAKQFPQITFKLKNIKNDKAYGTLTMRGVTKDVILDFENNGSIKDPWGNTRVGLALSGKVNRLDYGIKYNSVLEAGGVAVGETVKLDIELEGILSK